MRASVRDAMSGIGSGIARIQAVSERMSSVAALKWRMSAVTVSSLIAGVGSVNAFVRPLGDCIVHLSEVAYDHESIESQAGASTRPSIYGMLRRSNCCESLKDSYTNGIYR